VMICGGGGKDSNPGTVTDNTCGVIDLSDLSTAIWKMENFGGIPRIMPDVVFLADGKVMYLNGAGLGTAGFNRFQNGTITTLVADNADTVPVLYDHKAIAGQRFTTLANAGIPRMYHSVATLLPSGKVFISGSNPNNVVRTSPDLKFPTEYRNQIYSPPYFFKGIPVHRIKSVAGKTTLNNGAILVKFNTNVKVSVETTTSDVKFSAALIHFGFVTHSTHMSQRYVGIKITNTTLVSTIDNKRLFQLNVLMPPNGNIMPPGRHHYLFINNKGTPGATAIEVNLQK